MLKYPCKQNGIECPKRYPGCHGECEAFLTAKARNNAELDALKRERIADSVVAGSASERSSRFQYKCRKNIKLKGWK